MDWVDKPQSYKDLYGILQILWGSHLNNSLLKTLKLGWVAFHSVTFQSKCLDFQSNQYKKLAPVLSRFCNWLWMVLFILLTYQSPRSISIVLPSQTACHSTRFLEFLFLVSSVYWSDTTLTCHWAQLQLHKHAWVEASLSLNPVFLQEICEIWGYKTSHERQETTRKQRASSFVNS